MPTTNVDYPRSGGGNLFFGGGRPRLGPSPPGLGPALGLGLGLIPSPSTPSPSPIAIDNVLLQQLQRQYQQRLLRHYQQHRHHQHHPHQHQHQHLLGQYQNTQRQQRQQQQQADTAAAAADDDGEECYIVDSSNKCNSNSNRKRLPGACMEAALKSETSKRPRLSPDVLRAADSEQKVLPVPLPVVPIHSLPAICSFPSLEIPVVPAAPPDTRNNLELQEHVKPNLDRVKLKSPSPLPPPDSFTCTTTSSAHVKLDPKQERNQTIQIDDDIVVLQPRDIKNVSKPPMPCQSFASQFPSFGPLGRTGLPWEQLQKLVQEPTTPPPRRTLSPIILPTSVKQDYPMDPSQVIDLTQDTPHNVPNQLLSMLSWPPDAPSSDETCSQAPALPKSFHHLPQFGSELALLDQDDIEEQVKVNGLLNKAHSECDNLPMMEPPPSIVIPLKPYQKQGLHWMCQHDKEQGGGLLCDEMGMGKTLQMVSLIVQNHPLAYKSCGKSAGKHTAPALPDTEESEPEKEKSESESDSDSSDEDWHEETGHGRSEREKEDHNCPATLIVAPTTALHQWITEIRRYVNPKQNFDVLLYHGSSRHHKKSFSKYSVVLTSYGIISREAVVNKATQELVSSETPLAQRTGLFRYNWHRVVLDEAHIIKNPKSRVSRAACLLESKRRWCMTGTPFHNSAIDLWSLFHFIKVPVCADMKWYSEQVVQPLRGRNVRGLDALHCLVNTHMLRRTKSMQYAGKPILSLPPLHTEVVEIELSPEVRAFYDALWANSQDQFNEVLENEKTEYARLKKIREQYIFILSLLLHLRQMVLHPFLYMQSAMEEFAENKAAKVWDFDKLTEEFKKLVADPESIPSAVAPLAGPGDDCALCLEPMDTDIVFTPCKHAFCKGCILKSLEVNRSCPLCDAALSDTDLRKYTPPQAEKISSSVTTSSTKSSGEPPVECAKLNYLVKKLRELLAVDPKQKCLVFSQFTSFLDIVGDRLENEGFNTVRLDGAMSLNQRAMAVDTFQQCDSSMIFLVSLKVGGCALNLVAANVVFIMDPWWNPAIEQQAIERVHRLGQTKPVHCYQLIVRNSIEEKMKELQARKRATGDACIDFRTTPTLLAALSAGDLLKLFS
ncbi:DNA repair protein RAD5A [Pelomyxa schiedti]|nr:DNA repair protein RAD5A [Pelomyxa schiedti]